MSVKQHWRTDINQDLSTQTVHRERVRTARAVKKVVGGETPTVVGSVNVARGSGLRLLQQVNRLGEFVPPSPEELQQSAQRQDHTVRMMQELTHQNVVHRRNVIGTDKPWSDHVQGLYATTDAELAEAKIEFEERRRYLRSHLDHPVDSRGIRHSGNGRESYKPETVASQHSIALGMPSNQRREYDERRQFLRSNLTQEERLALAKQRGDPMLLHGGDYN